MFLLKRMYERQNMYSPINIEWIVSQDRHFSKDLNNHISIVCVIADGFEQYLLPFLIEEKFIENFLLAYPF